MGKLNRCIFLIKDDELLEKYNSIWDKVSANIKRNLIESLSMIKNFENQSSFTLVFKFTDGDGVTDFYDKDFPKERTLIILV